MRLLFVEDDPGVAASVTWALSAEGHQVRHVADERHLFGLIRHHHPDAVILDITLPNLDGVMLATIVRRSWPDLPIIFTSGHDQYMGLADALENPKTVHLQKPFAIDELERVLEDLVTHLN